MAISRSQTGKTVKLKPPPHLRGHQGVIKSSSPRKKKEPKKPLLPASKKNFKKYKHKVKGIGQTIPGGQANVLWKFVPDVKD